MLKKILLALIAVVGVAVWLAVRGKEPPAVPFVPVTRETLVSTLTTNGKVEPIQWASVRAEISGPVGSIRASRGDTVRAGSVLVTIKATEAESDLASAQSRVNQAQAELQTLASGGRAPDVAEIESGLSRARADLATARREYEILQRLFAKRAATQAEVTAAKEAVEKAELQIQSLERRRGSLVTQPDRSAANARLREAESAAQAASKRIASSEIRSPIDGVLYAFELRPGAYVNAGDEIGRVGQISRLRVIVYVDEPELGRVQKGMPVTITWDALPGREWTGEVESVPSQVVTLGTRQVGEVLCSIGNPNLTLIPGTNVNVEIRSSVVPNALTIPKEALRREENSSIVLKLEGDRVVSQKVRLGVASVTRVQVIQGLSEGDKVALAADTALKNRDRVRPVPR